MDVGSVKPPLTLKELESTRPLTLKEPESIFNTGKTSPPSQVALRLEVLGAPPGPHPGLLSFFV